MKTLFVLFFCTSLAFASPEIGFDTDTLKFGYISEGGGHSRVLGVANDGTTDLIINSVTMPDPVFSLISPALPATIAAGEQQTFLVGFNPDLMGNFDGNFVFGSNDPANPNAVLPGRADGIPVFTPGQVIWSYQGVENVVTCTAVEDINGDGMPDVVAESYDAGAPQQDHLFCISGSGFMDGSVIWSARPMGGPSNSGGYGDNCLKPIDDLNGNGVEDLIYGTAWGSRTVFALEGADGQTIWSYDTYDNPPSGWIYAVNKVDDLNGDGIPEVVAGAGSYADAGFCFDGASGTLLWKKQALDVVYGAMGIDDVNGDNVSDVVFGAGENDDKVYCISGASTGFPLNIWTFSTGGTIYSMDRIADIDNDSYNDVIIGTWYNGHKIFALSGHSVTSTDTIWTTSVGFPIMKVVTCDDLNNDGYEDILVASWSSYAEAISGLDGSSIWRYFCGDDVWAIYWAHDVTGDGIVDVAAGSFTGSVYLINGASGALIWESPSEAKIFTVRPIKDVNGDGYDDIIAGQQMLSGQGGRFFIISGGTVEPTSIEDQEIIQPEEIALLANYPNPFNASTSISFNLTEWSTISLEIYNVAGQKVAGLIDGELEAGEHTVNWNARDDNGSSLATGVYFCRLNTGTKVLSRKMMLVK